MEAADLEPVDLDRYLAHPTTARAAASASTFSADVVDPEEGGTTLVREDGCRDTGRDRTGHRVLIAENAPQEALARGADEYRPAERDELVQPRQQLEVVLHRLPESDSRVEADPSSRRSRPPRRLEPFLEKRGDLRDDVVVAGVVLHRPRLAEHVHEAEVGAALRDDSGEVGVGAQCRDVVDDDGAELECAPGDLRLRGVDRDRKPARPSSTGTTRRSSSSSDTPSEPGRVDSPPTSTSAAPSSSKRRACAIAWPGSRTRPRPRSCPASR